jgi:hypothetical protein
MEIKDQIAIVLKEYDALRKEIDDRLNAPKLYFVPLLFVFLGGVLGWKAELPIDLVLLFILPVLLTFLSFAVNAGYYVQRAGKQIAKIEDKVFRLSGLSLLTHESEIIHHRQQLPTWGLPLLSAITGAFYILIEARLFYEFDSVRNNQFAIFFGRKFILISLLAIPLMLFWFSAIRLAYLQRSLLSFRSKLLDDLSANNYEYLIGSLASEVAIEHSGNQGGIKLKDRAT